MDLLQRLPEALLEEVAHLLPELEDRCVLRS
jgi:hypothetical protein